MWAFDPEFENGRPRFESHVLNSKWRRQVETMQWMYLGQLSYLVYLNHQTDNAFKNFHSLSFLLTYSMYNSLRTWYAAESVSFFNALFKILVNLNLDVIIKWVFLHLLHLILRGNISLAQSGGSENMESWNLVPESENPESLESSEWPKVINLKNMKKR